MRRHRKKYSCTIQCNPQYQNTKSKHSNIISVSTSRVYATRTACNMKDYQSPRNWRQTRMGVPISATCRKDAIDEPRETTDARKIRQVLNGENRSTVRDDGNILWWSLGFNHTPSTSWLRMLWRQNWGNALPSWLGWYGGVNGVRLQGLGRLGYITLNPSFFFFFYCTAKKSARHHIPIEFTPVCALKKKRFFNHVALVWHYWPTCPNPAIWLQDVPFWQLPRQGAA